jgi:hypothetical protein
VGSNPTLSAKLSSKKGLNCPFFYLFPQMFPHKVGYCYQFSS